DQLRVLNRMETWEHLTPQQKQQALEYRSQMRQLPPDRQRMVKTAVRDLRAMTPDQRERVINSDRFKGMFSDKEREMMREAARLPLLPATEGEAGPQPYLATLSISLSSLMPACAGSTSSSAGFHRRRKHSATLEGRRRDPRPQDGAARGYSAAALSA